VTDDTGTASTPPLIGDSKAMRQIHAIVKRAAPTSATVLVRGESGTGKELIARLIHDQGPRRDLPLVTLNCGALPDALLESELFGYERGAFTGAFADKPGRVELAQGGTLFLDEIGDVTPALQVKLLRLLQEREFERLGGKHTLRADVRFLAATHRDLESMIKAGEFREDLFYRLNVVTIWVPPLRARRTEIPALAQHFCAVLSAASGRSDMQLAPDAIELLRAQRWPGNVRQLQNFVERLVVLSDGPQIDVADVQRELQQQTVTFSTQTTGSAGIPPRDGALRSPERQQPSLEQELREAERQALRRALERTNGNRTHAARVLGVSRATLYKKLHEHGFAEARSGRTRSGC